jgi:urea transport system permease protein
VIGAAFVSLLSTWFTGGQVPDINLGFYTIEWVDWWRCCWACLRPSRCSAPKGIGGLVDLLTAKRPIATGRSAPTGPSRKEADE